jgi:hypothetical protein
MKADDDLGQFTYIQQAIGHVEEVARKQDRDADRER